MTSPQKPPPLAAGGRLLEYAVLDERATYSGHSYLFVDGNELGPVPRRATAVRAAEGRHR